MLATLGLGPSARSRIFGEAWIQCRDPSDDADSDGRWDYALWVYDPKAQTLSRGRWSQEELSKKGLPAPRQEPTQQEWEKYFGVSLVLVASSVQEFQFGPPPPPDTGLRLSFKIKNPARSGRTDEYVLQLEESP